MPKPLKPTRKSSQKSSRVGNSGAKANSLSAKQISQLTDEYKRAIKREWSVLRVDETEILLKDVYVMLQAVASPSPKELEKRSDLAESPERMMHAGFEPQEAHPVPIQLSQALNGAKQLVLLGEPGSGKSTTLQFIGLSFVHEDWVEKHLQLTEKRIPIKLNLREYTEILANPGIAMEQALGYAVQEFIRDLNGEDAHELVEVWRDQGQLLILLDGLDEVPDQQRGAVRNEIQKFASWSMDRRCRLVVASRLAGYSALGGEFKDFTLKPFAGVEEVIPYLESWLAILREGQNLEQAKEEAISLHKQMAGQPALRQVLDNPLLLRIAVQVYTSTGQIASSRANLYTFYIEDLWLRAVERGADRSKKDAVWQFIRDLAWDLQNKGTPNIPAEMEMVVREKMGLIVRAVGGVGFSHTTFREYFVAERLVIVWQNNPASAWAFIRPRLHISVWREPIMLLCGRLDAERAGQLVLQVLNARSPYERHLYRDKLLAAALIGQNPLIAANIKNRLIDSLLLLSKDKNENARWIAAEALGDMRAIEAVPALLQAFKDKTVLVRKGAAEALGEIRAIEAVPALLQAFKDGGVSYEVAGALGKIRATEVVPDLILALKSENAFVRERAAEVLGEMRAVEAVPDLILALKGTFVREGATEATLAFLDESTDEDRFFREQVSKILREMKAVEAVPALLQALEDKAWYVRKAAAEALGEIKAAAPTLLQALKNKDVFMREGAAQALGEMRAIEAVPALLEALKDQSWDVRRAAVKALGKIKAAEAIPALLQILKDGEVSHTGTRVSEKTDDSDAAFDFFALKKHEAESYSPTDDIEQMQSVEFEPYSFRERKRQATREAAAEALGEMMAVEAIPDLILALDDQVTDVRRAAAESLGKMSAVEAIPNLILVLKYDAMPVYAAAARALGKMKAAEAVPDFMQVLKGQVWDLYPKPTEPIGGIKPTEPVPDFILTQILEAREVKYMRQAAATALGEMRAIEAVPALLQALKHKDELVRQAAAQALGEMKAVEVVPALISALKDQSEDVRWATAEALGEMRAVKAVPALLQMLKDKEWLVSNTAATALETIIGSQPIPTENRERRKVVKILQKVMLSKLLLRYGDALRVAEQLAVLDLDNSPYRDLSKALEPSVKWNTLRFSGYILLVILISGLLAVLVTVYGTAQDIFKTIINPTISSWIFAHPVSAFVTTFFGLAIIVGLLAWALESLKDTIKDRK